MKFIELVNRQKLSETEEIYAEHVCKEWKYFSDTIGKMNKSDTLKVLKYIVDNRPTSHTLGKRAVQRFNTLNKVKWEDLINGNRKTNRDETEGDD